ncbi:MAG: hypothetical protein FWD97_07430 [Defluviitaleaceae bacterium]|nr:hypothetical protein [Defluviitaleaceae bacterium]
MELFTERHGMRKPVNKTSIMTEDMYKLIFNCCEKYYEHLSHLFPEGCPDWPSTCCGLDRDAFLMHMKFRIPNLFGGVIDQYALLDLVEYIAKNCRDFRNLDWHGFFGHHHIEHLETNEIFGQFQKEINDIFELTGLLFVLTDTESVERVIDEGVLTPTTIEAIEIFTEKGVRELLNDALYHYKQPHPSSRKTACEKIWGAFERIKTYYTDRNKKLSGEEVVKKISDNRQEFVELFDAEFKVLTEMGNKFDVRHKETNTIEIVNPLHHDYFFNRCLSLIMLVINTLGVEVVEEQQFEDDDLPF